MGLLSSLPLVVPVPAAAASGYQVMVRRVRELERQNAELLRRLERVEQRLPATASGRSSGPVPPSPVAAMDAPAVEIAAENPGLGMGVQYGPVQASFQIFGDVGAMYEAPRQEDVHTAFTAGTFDTFATAKIGDHFQTLAEVVLEGDSQDNEFGLDLERLWGAWTFDDRLYIKLGREHSPTSRWERRFHHGRWLWTSATQPFLARFEDDGGILPVHQVGIEVGGRLKIAPGMLQYAAVVSNGRGRTPDEITNFGDRNDAKAYDAGLSFAPAAWYGWSAGGNFHADDIPNDRTRADRRHGMRELIGSAFVERTVGEFELLGEYAFLDHHDRTSGRTFRHHSGYAQAGYRYGAFTPFARFDMKVMAAGDPYFATNGIDRDQWEQVLGLRYDLTTFAAVKLEGAIGEHQATAGGGYRLAQRFGLQLSWVF